MRKLCYRLSKYEHFDNLILTLIIIGSLKLAADTYLPQSSDANLSIQDKKIIRISNGINYFFNIFFATESLIKIISFGLIYDKGSYLRDNWNILDFFIVVSSILDMSFENINLPIIKVKIYFFI